MDNPRAAREAPGRQERRNWTTWEALRTQERTNGTAWEVGKDELDSLEGTGEARKD